MRKKTSVKQAPPPSASQRGKTPKPADRKSAPPSASAAAHALAAANRGAELLCMQPGTLRELAERVGMSVQALHEWRAGHKRPAAVARGRLEYVLKIPLDAWDHVPSTHPDYALVSTLAAAGGTAPTTLRAVADLVASIRAQRMNPKLLNAEREKLFTAELRALAQLHRLEREAEMTEDRIIREHPKWRAIVRVWTAALVPFPAAAKAVADALASVGDF